VRPTPTTWAQGSRILTPFLLKSVPPTPIIGAVQGERSWSAMAGPRDGPACNRLTWIRTMWRNLSAIASQRPTPIVPDGNMTVDAYGFLVGAWISLDQAIAAAQQAQAVPPLQQELQLTTIEGPQTGLSCWYAFDQNGESIFGSWDYEDSESTYFGVNGQRLRFTETYTDSEVVFDSPEGYQITARQGAQIRDESYYEYTAGLWETSVTIRRGNAEMTYQIYKFCGDG
jgi:hypothetical protein